MSSSRRKKFSPLPVELQITGLAHDGRGIARPNNKTTFVFGALIGETVQAKYTRSYNRFDEATAIAIKSPSPLRAPVSCEHFSLCGGCQLQHMVPEQQIQHKQALLAEQLMHQKIEPQEWLAPLVGNFTGYRQKARLAVRYIEKKQTVAVGFREQKNNKIAIIESCAVLDPRVGLQIHALRELIQGLEGRQAIAQIEVAIGGEEVALIFRHMQPLSPKDQEAMQAFCQQKQFSFYLQSGGAETVQKIWPTNSSLLLTYALSDQNLRFAFHPLDFTQVNPLMNQKMINQALALLAPTKDDDILDLFCGLGNFSLPLAQLAQSVVGIEGVQEMVARAADNAKCNQLVNVEFFTCDLDEDFTQKDPKIAPWVLKKFNKILLDPSRNGAQRVVEEIHRFQAKDILYVSCNPATFVRDAAILVHQQGYRLRKIGGMDMFTHTAHVEVMGLFSKE